MEHYPQAKSNILQPNTVIKINFKRLKCNFWTLTDLKYPIKVEQNIFLFSCATSNCLGYVFIKKPSALLDLVISKKVHLCLFLPSTELHKIWTRGLNFFVSLYKVFSHFLLWQYIFDFFNTSGEVWKVSKSFIFSLNNVQYFWILIVKKQS